MAFSAKIILGDGGVSGYNEWEVIYDASTQPTYKTRYGLSVSQPETDILWHQPDEGAETPVRATPRNKQMELTMIVKSSDGTFDDIISSLIPLKLALNGADSQALDSTMNGTSERVKVAITPDGSAYTTYYNVISGTIDDSQAYTSDVAIVNTVAWDISFLLTVEPFGYGDAISPQNDLASSPHFIEYNTSASIADGWSTFGTSPTGLSPSTARYIVGGKSQFFQVDNTNNSGIQSDPVTASTSTDAVASVWVQAGAPNQDTLSISLRDGSSNIIQEKDFDPSGPTGYDKTYIDAGGFTWYRYVVSGTNTTAANFIIVIRRSAGNASIVSAYYVDVAYLQIDTTTMPDAWCSTISLKNRYDPSVAEANINYLDVFGVPGDLPAKIQAKITATTGNTEAIRIVSIRDGNDLAEKYPYWIDSADFSLDSGWTETADANYIGGSYSLTNVPNSGMYMLYGITDDAEARWLAEIPALVFILGYASNSATTLDVSFGLAGEYYPVFDGVSPYATSTNTIIEVGLLNITNDKQAWSETSSPTRFVRIGVSGSSGTARVDGVYIFPLAQYMLSEIRDTGTGLIAIIDGVLDKLYLTFNSPKIANYIGEIPNISAGNKMTRLIFNAIGQSSIPTYELQSITADIVLDEFQIIPRCSHLLGVA